MGEATQQGLTAELYKAIITIVDQRIGEIKVAREEFDSLQATVRELVKVQAGTERALASLTTRVEELTEAQKRTEARVEELAEAQKRTEARVEELAQAQVKTEARLDSLTVRVEELAEAQKRTEARVEELAEAQKRTEARVEELAEAQKRTEARVEELAEAQKRTEARVEELAQAQRRTEARVEELAQAQAKTEARLDSLTARVEELAEAQKRTEARVEELAEAQKRTEARVEELAQAQAKTEKILQGVIKEQKSMKKEIGGLSATIGYTLENRAIVKLPRILEREHGIKVEAMDRRFVEYPDGREEEINIYGEARRNGERLYIIGESKSQLGRRDVDKFRKRIARLGALYPGKILPIIVTHLASPKVERYALKAIDGLLIFKSYQLED